ncbi:hypothetical protein MNV49_003420 [Pseudohyphozyma bogoriensis]|nr:hypothetical protein MNV49_003420 [Pseudohyphozyma bogoriensis]
MSLPFQIAGGISLATAVGHLHMGLTMLKPGLNLNSLEARTALGGWYEGTFAFVVFGLNYLRLARSLVFTRLDYLMILSQVGMNVFAVLNLEPPPARILNAIIGLSAITGVVLRR